MELKKYKLFINNYFIRVAVFDFVFAYAVYTVFFSISGLSAFQISLLLTFWCFSAAILEIPSGAFADYWSRKKMMVIAPFFKSLCFVFWFFANGNIYILGLGFLFWALGSSFMSGTKEALLYDNLVYFDKKNEYAKIIGKTEFYKQIAQVIAMLSGAFMAAYNLKFAIIFSIIPLVASSIFSYFLHQAPKIKSTNEIKYLGYIKIAFKEIRSSKILLILFVCSLVFGIFGNLDEFDQLYYQFVGLPIWMFGIAGAIWSGINATGAFFAHKFEKKHFIYFTIPIISGILLFITGYFPAIWMIGAIMASYLLISPLHILIDTKIQHNISSGSRATITSAAKFLLEIIGGFSFLIFGVLAEKFSIPTIYWISGLCLLVFSVWIFKVRKVFAEK
jgi:MFS family permease